MWDGVPSSCDTSSTHLFTGCITSTAVMIVAIVTVIGVVVTKAPMQLLREGRHSAHDIYAALGECKTPLVAGQ